MSDNHDVYDPDPAHAVHSAAWHEARTMHALMRAATGGKLGSAAAVVEISTDLHAARGLLDRCLAMASKPERREAVELLRATVEATDAPLCDFLGDVARYVAHR